MSELEDFEAFLEEDFDPIVFASALLQATNVADDTELDLSTSIKKLQFDANECDKRIRSQASTHHTELLESLDKIEINQKYMTEVINPSVSRLRNAYKRINNEVISPYEDATKLNDALKRLHQTLMLLRGAGFFVGFLQQLHDCEKSLQRSEDNREVIRKAKLLKQVSSFYTQQNKNKKSSTFNLLSIKLVREYAPQSESKSVEFIEDLSSQIYNDLGHHSTFVADNSVLQNNLLALYIMDPKELVSVIDRGAITKSLQIALASLTRSLQSPRVLKSAFAEVKESTQRFSTQLSNLLDNCDISKADSNCSEKTLLQAFQKSISEPNLLTVQEVYWSRLAHKFKKNVAATMARGGPVAKNLRSQHKSLVESVVSVLEDKYSPLIKDALDIIDLRQ